MAYNRRTGKLNLQRASLATLEKYLKEARERTEFAESSLATERLKRGRSASSQLQEILAQLGVIDARLSSLRQIRQPKQGFFANIFGLTEQPPDVKAEISSLVAQQATLQQRRWEFDQIENNIRFWGNSVERARSWQLKLVEAVGRKRRKKEALIELRAAAASNSTESRKIASTVKRKLIRQPWCPYCGGDLGTNPHADHIYPVCKGGRSVPRNMVYVCSDCNTLKLDLTLSGFILKYGLDRSAVECRLKELGKEF